LFEIHCNTNSKPYFQPGNQILTLKIDKCDNFVKESTFNKSSLLTFISFQKKDIYLNLCITRFWDEIENFNKLLNKLEEIALIHALNMNSIG